MTDSDWVLSSAVQWRLAVRKQSVNICWYIIPRIIWDQYLQQKHKSSR